MKFINIIHELLIHLNFLLSRLGYPQGSLLAIIKEFDAFFDAIGFLSLKSEFAQGEIIDTNKVPVFMKLMGQVRGKAFTSTTNPSTLVKFLVNSLCGKDIFALVKTLTITEQDRNKLYKLLNGCAALSQIGYITLFLMNVEVRGATAVNLQAHNRNVISDHALTIVPAGNGTWLFMDFPAGYISYLHYKQFYAKEGNYWVLKRKLRFTSECLDETCDKIAKTGMRHKLSFQERLNVDYFSIHILERVALTSALYGNIASVYCDIYRYRQQEQKADSSKIPTLGLAERKKAIEYRVELKELLPVH